jgi:hypothetical protein
MLNLRGALVAVLLINPAQHGFSDRGMAGIYIAAADLLPPADLALDPEYLPQRPGHAAERIPRGVIALLMQREVISEVCGKTPGVLYGCVSRRARWVVRLSRPVRRAHGEVEVEVSRATVRPAWDTTSAPVEGFAESHTCVVARRDGQWVRLRCQGGTVT